MFALGLGLKVNPTNEWWVVLNLKLTEVILEFVSGSYLIIKLLRKKKTYRKHIFLDDSMSNF